MEVATAFQFQSFIARHACGTPAAPTTLSSWPPAPPSMPQLQMLVQRPGTVGCVRHGRSRARVGRARGQRCSVAAAPASCMAAHPPQLKRHCQRRHCLGFSCQASCTRMIRTLQRLLACPQVPAAARAALSRPAPSVSACRNFASASDNSSSSAGTARDAVAAVIKEVFGGQQSTLARSAKKVLNAPSIGAQVNSWCSRLAAALQLLA